MAETNTVQPSDFHFKRFVRETLQDRPFLRPREGYWNTIEDEFHWHLQILPQIVRVTGFEWAPWFFYSPVPPEVAARYLSSGGQV